MSRRSRRPAPLPHLPPCEHCSTDQPPEKAASRGGGSVWICRGCGGPRG